MMTISLCLSKGGEVSQRLESTCPVLGFWAEKAGKEANSAQAFGRSCVISSRKPSHN